MGEGRRLTCNMSYILPEGDDADAHVGDAHFEVAAVRHMEHRNMH
jgi:hypothetical protein